MKRKTPVIRMQRLKRLNRKEQVVFPSPLIMLRSTVFVYRNGQIHASVRIKFSGKRTFEQKNSNPFPEYQKNTTTKTSKQNAGTGDFLKLRNEVAAGLSFPEARLPSAEAWKKRHW